MIEIFDPEKSQKVTEVSTFEKSKVVTCQMCNICKMSEISKFHLPFIENKRMSNT